MLGLKFSLIFFERIQNERKVLMTTHNLKNNKDFNFVNMDINVGNKDIMPLDTPVKPEYDNMESSSLLSSDNDTYTLSTSGEKDKSSSLSPSGLTRGSRSEMNPCFLDTRVKHEYDNSASSCHSGLRAGIQRDDNLMPKAFRFSQSGRSMVEMLGTLAIIGVLSIGGIAGYSYGMDKYRANTIINDIMLRSVDVMAQFDRTGKVNLSEWPTITASKYTIGLEEGTTGIQVNDLPKRLCQMMFDGMINTATVKVGSIEYDLATDDDVCGDTNAMVFYVDDTASTKTEETTTTTTPTQKFCTIDAQCGENEFCGDKGDTVEYMEPYICKSSKYTEKFIAGKTIYVLETPMGWWDTKTVCEKLGGRMPTTAESLIRDTFSATDFSIEVSSTINSSFWVNCPECGEPAACGKSCVSMGFPDIHTGICIID